MAISKVNFNSLNVTPTASKVLKFNSSNDGLEAGDVGGALVLISEQTASSSSTINFTSGIDSTYKEYIFKFINIHPATDNSKLQFQADTGTNTNYNQTIHTTFFHAANNEGGTDSGPVEYETAHDKALGTSYQDLNRNVGNDSDQVCCGFLRLFEPSSSVFVKHFFSTISTQAQNEYNDVTYIAGYFNVTTPITRVSFKMNTGNIDSGTIKMYGVT